MFSESLALNSRTAAGTPTRFCWGLWQNHQLGENTAIAFHFPGIHGLLLMLRCGVLRDAKEIGNKQKTQESVSSRIVSSPAENPPATKYDLDIVAKI